MHIELHGFASQGAFISTANDYIGHSSRGSLELFEAGLNVSSQITDRLRVGAQLFSRDEGLYTNYSPILDWAFLDYRYKPWLGLRAGHIKIPFGLYNEYVDIDAARVSLLLPQSVYPIGNREVLLALTGGDAYGTIPLDCAGELDYQAYAGTLNVPIGMTTRAAPQVYAVDTHYVVGGQLFYHPPIEGLKVGGSVLRAWINFHLDLDSATAAGLVAAGLVPKTFNGQLTESFEPVTLAVASAEYTHDDWTFAAEYARWNAHVTWSQVLPTQDVHSERFYGLATYRLNDQFALGGYYSVFYPNASDRGGHDPSLKKPFYAWQRDAALSLRWDVNDHWLWKFEGHLIDGVASLFDGAVLDPTLNQSPSRFWGMFLLRTTVTF